DVTAPPTQVDGIAADQLARGTLTFPTFRRGRLAPGRLRITSIFPLGLFRAWAYLEPAVRVTVYPRPDGRAELPATAEFHTRHYSGTRRGTDDFTGFQQYRPGDSIRSIAWKAVAREQGLLTKRF